MSRPTKPQHVDTPGLPGTELQARDVIAAAKWLCGSTVRTHRLKMILISVAQVFGAAGTALGTIAVLFYIRAAAGDGTFGRINFRIESAAEPATAIVFLTGVLAIILAAAFSMWRSERAIADLALDHASHLRSMILKLIDSPLSANWQDRSGFRRPEIEVQQVLVGRTRSMTVALTDVLALVPSFAVLIFSVSIALFIDSLAALLLLPFVIVFAMVSERLNRRIQTLTATFEGRQERTRIAMAAQLKDLFAGQRTYDEVSTTRVSSDDRLFHDRQLETTKLKLLGIVNSAILFALTAAFFIIFRGVENLAIEEIIAYIFAIRFAARSGEQILKALAQVSRRYEDILSVSDFIAQLDEVRLRNVGRHHSAVVPEEFTIRVNDTPLTITRGKAVIILCGRPVTEEYARSVLRLLADASDHPGLDLATGCRVMLGDNVEHHHDILADSSVRVVVTDSPANFTQHAPREFTFIMHNRPKVLLGAQARLAADSFGLGLVIGNGAIAWAGPISAVQQSDQHIRELLRADKAAGRSNDESRVATKPVQK